MKKLKKVISLFTAILCLFCVVSTLSAEEEIPLVIFNNTRNTSPDLFVNKHVVSADELYQAPEDAVFKFILKLDGNLANQVTYRLFDKDGNEVFKQDALGNKIPFKTDRSGTFTLTAEQTAQFEDVGLGVHYEVTEVPTDQFEQTIPAGGAAIGTIPKEGGAAYFTNTYIPDDPDIQTTKLQVQKSVTFPDGYELPEPPDFPFALKLKGKAYANETYTITDTATGETLGTGTTDAEGNFTLKGGQTATFPDIPVDIDYEVTEGATQGWHTVGSTTKEGATKAPVTYAGYVNGNASFVVTKRLADHQEAEEDFTFSLTDQDNKVMPGIKYYLYNTAGERLDDQIYETGAKGDFVLQPGQAAVFFGVEVGTVYNVKEEAHNDFMQKVPTTTAGYTQKEVKDAVEILPFVNEPRDDVRVLSVMKRVENTTEYTSAADEEFTFVLYQKVDDEYIVLADAVYRISQGSSEATYKTDENGIFHLKANQVARFESLKKGIEYKVEEINLGVEYQIAEAEKTGVLDTSLYFTYINEFTPKKTDISLIKRNDKEEPLTGAFFKLYADQDLTRLIGEYTSDTDGKINISDLVKGTYYLVETQAPAGYQKLTAPLQIEITMGDDGIEVKVNGKKYDEDTSKTVYIVHQTEGNDELHMTVYNHSAIIPPITGGTGIKLTILLLFAIIGPICFQKWLRKKSFTAYAYFKDY